MNIEKIIKQISILDSMKKDLVKYFISLKKEYSVYLDKVDNNMKILNVSIIKSKIVHGTLGQNSPNAKLNDDIVREIKYRLLKVREKMTTLAIEYNISYNYIQKIKYGKVWKHIILK